MGKIILTVMLCACFMAAWASEEAYITDDGNLNVLGFTNNMYVMRPEDLAAARQQPECRPAADFPEGNWGPVESGYQLSLRLNKPAYTNGEPIFATLLMRNVTNAAVYLHYGAFPMDGEYGPIGFVVTSKSGVLTPREFGGPYIVTTAAFRWVLPGTQAKYVERLNRRYDLTNGTYTVQAVKSAWVSPWPVEIKDHHVIFNRSSQQTVQVNSAEVKITIKNSP
jgi:hypothetical protein